MLSLDFKDAANWQLDAQLLQSISKCDLEVEQAPEESGDASREPDRGQYEGIGWQ